MNLSWLIKYIIIILSTILKLTAALITAPHLTELGKILSDAVHCLYCNPGYYPHGLLWYSIVIPLSYFVDSKIVMMEFALIDMAILILLIKHPIFIPYFFVSFISFFVIP